MKKLFIIIFPALTFATGAFSQKIQKVYAFYTQTIPGMAMTDEKGNVINPAPVIDRFLYVECAQQPDIIFVKYNGITFSPAIQSVPEMKMNVGISERTGKPVIITAKKGSHLWRIDLQLTSDQFKAPGANVPMVIRGFGKRTKNAFTAFAETQLHAPDRP